MDCDCRNCAGQNDGPGWICTLITYLILLAAFLGWAFYGLPGD